MQSDGRDAAEPLFSILIGRASTEDRSRIFDTLDALRHQDAPLAYEVVIVDRRGDEITEAIESSYAEARLIRCDRNRALPEMRAMALRAARAKYVVVTEDHCVPCRSWLRAFEEMFRLHPEAAAVGGCVANGITDSTFDWATYLCEYAALAPPIEERADGELTGVNVAYIREVLENIPMHLLTGGFWETTVHPVLLRQGRVLLTTNDVCVYHCKKFSFDLFISQRLAYSRYFAGNRFRYEQRLMRTIAAVASLGLPILLAARLLRAVRRKRSILKPALQAAPYLLLFFLVWAAGELIGYLAGPGAALREIE